MGRCIVFGECDVVKLQMSVMRLRSVAHVVQYVKFWYIDSHYVLCLYLHSK